jgi:scyllo-inositol 2-dehydrogenase (NADP+)
MKKVNVGLIGYGVSGKVFHAPLLKAHPGYEITIVSSSRADEVKADLPNARVVSSYLDVIHNMDVELVINCAPNAYHFSYAESALLAGKHVVVEKPFVNTVEEAQKLIELSKTTGKLLSVFQNRRWDGDFLTIRKLVSENTLGNLKQFETHFDRWRPVVRSGKWREQAGPGHGAFFDLGPHLIDQVLQLFGMPEKILADIEIQKDKSPVDDYFHLILFYGIMRVIVHGTSYSSKTPRFQLLGDHGNYIKYGLDVQEDQLRAGILPTEVGYGVEAETSNGKLGFMDKTPENYPTEKGDYPAFYRQLYQAISHGDSLKLPVSAMDALKVIHLIELSQKSSKLGTALVPIRFNS